VAQRLQIGIETVVQAYGVGSLKANTILLNWLGQSPARILGLQSKDFGKNLRSARLYGCNIVILDAKEDKWETLEQAGGKQRHIDVWWWDDATSRLMLLLAYLATRHEKWTDAKIRLLAAGTKPEADRTIESLKEMLEDVRIEAAPEIVEDVDADTLAEYSADASLVFLPFRIRNDDVIDPFGNTMDKTLFLLPVTALVLAAEDIDLDAEPEEGEAAETAETLDALEDARKKAEAKAKEAAKATEAAEKAREEAEKLTAESKDVEADLKTKAEKTAEEAEKQAVKMARKAAKAAAKADTAAREAEASGVLAEDDTDAGTTKPDS
jgi:hypothetical protein